MTDIFIKRPVFSIVVSLLIVFVGLLAIKKIPLRQFPNITPSVINITTNFGGASASTMESFITTPIENVVSGIDGIDFITSSSTAGQSSVSIHFRLGKDIDKVATDVSDKVSSIRWKLPKEADDSIITKDDPNTNPVLFIAFTSKTISGAKITDYLERVVNPQLEIVPGVGRSMIFGQTKYAMRIWLDPIRMAEHDVTAADVYAMLQKNNLQTTAGRIQEPYQEYEVTATTDLQTAEQFNNLVIKETEGSIVRIKDVGEAKLGAETPRASAIMNGKPANVIGVIPKTTANPLTVATLVTQTLPGIKAKFPPGLDAYIAWDNSKFIRASLKEVVKTLVEAMVIIVLVIFLCLGSLRAVLIPVVTIPLSLIGVCAFMLAMGYSLNTLTFLAAVLAIGLVVDDAIVVVENIHRHIEQGKTPFQAALDGAREIKFAVIAMTLTLAAVFAPIGFSGGLTGALFKEFAFALAGAVIVSGFVALTLSPMMCSTILRADIFHKPFPQKVENVFNQITSKYQELLSKIFACKFKYIATTALSIVAMIALINIFLFTTTQEDLAPVEDQGVVMLQTRGPTSANLKYMEKYNKQLIPILTSVPEHVGYGYINGWGGGVNSAFGFLPLKPWDERKRNTNQIIQEIFPKLMSIPGVMAFAFNFPALPGGGNQGVGFVVKSTGSYKQLADVMEQLKFKAMSNPKLMNVDSDLHLNKPEVSVNIDRDLAGDMGISMADISTTLRALLGEPTASRFTMNGRSYNVTPQLYASYREDPGALNKLQIRTASGELTPLSNIISTSMNVVPISLDHFQQQRAATLTASTVPGYTVGEALEFLKTEASKILSDDMTYDFVGESRQLVEASGVLAMMFFYAIVFILLVLSAQFESFVDAVIVLISVTFSFLGAMLAIRLTGATLNIYTQIGLVTLIGLISKHGILMIEFTNQLREQGMVRGKAIIKAAVVRLRPILMTTAAMTVGAIPLVRASGAGSASRSQLGWVIVGGMTIGTLFTLFVVPMIYSSVHGLLARVPTWQKNKNSS